MACATSSTRSGARSHDHIEIRSSPRKRGTRGQELDSRFRGNERSSGSGLCMTITEAPHRSNAPPPVPLLDIKDLTVEFSTRRGIVKAVQNINIEVAKGETLAIVGESGSGKSVTSFAVMRILDRAGRIAEGSVMFSGVDVRAADDRSEERRVGKECR